MADVVEKVLATDSGDVRYWVSRLGGNGASAATDASEAPWLVFLPGLTADHRLFDAQMDYFADKANCLVWDPPAHGASRPFPLDFTMDDLARMVHDICEQEGVARPVLVGQSMGGYVSQAFMDLYPGRAAGFVSVDSAPLQKRYIPDWELAMLRHTKGMYLAIPWGLLKKWGAWGTARTEKGRAQMRSFMDGYDKREYCELAAYGYKLLADAITAGRPYEVDCPALLLCGEHDAAGDVKKFNRKWTGGSGTPLEWVPDAGHNSNADNPAFVNAAIERFLAEAVG